ncbi:nucleotidyltransferase domain-containing protein [Egicoccus sp. AB-alg2]|uniref:nucleotidyltransferase domain-containing protein n=1 Tax=Egicoccus sp. AB-alg2 TaxID=3242693 RepID=UPI00359D7DE6
MRSMISHGSDVDVVTLLRDAGVPFAFLHGSRAAGTSRAGSDLDVAAWLGADVDELELRSRLPEHVDLLVLDNAPLELAGRVAMHGEVILDADRPARVAWQATMRKIFADERYRIERARRDFADTHRG